MAALPITASQVLPVSGLRETGIGGAAITQGQAVHYDGAGKWKPAQCDGTAVEAGAEKYGIALTACAADGQPVVVALPGAVVNLGAGAAAVAGTVYFVGATAGALNVAGDLSSTNKVTPICYGVGTNRVKVLDHAYDAGSVKP